MNPNDDFAVRGLPDVPKIKLPSGNILFGADYGPNLGARVVLDMGPLTLGVPADQIDLMCAYLTACKNQALAMERKLRQRALELSEDQGAEK